MSRREIKRPPAKRGRNILPPEPAIDDDGLPPAFGFYATVPGYGLADLAPEDLRAVVAAIVRRSQMTWRQMWAAPHDKLGLEPMPQRAITVPIPPIVTKDKVLLVLRCGDFRRLIGFRDGRIFVVVWIDCGGAVYGH